MAERKPSPEAWRRAAPALARLYRAELERREAEESESKKDAAA